MDVDVDKPMARIHYTLTPEFDMGQNGYLGKYTHAVTPAILFKSWRVVSFGFWVYAPGISGEDPSVTWGIEDSDIGAESANYFGQIKQSTTLNQEWVKGDMILYDPLSFLKEPLPVENGGSFSYATSEHFLEWQELGAVLTCTRPNDHDLGVVPVICIEVRR